MQNRTLLLPLGWREDTYGMRGLAGRRTYAAVAVFN